MLFISVKLTSVMLAIVPAIRFVRLSPTSSSIPANTNKIPPSSIAAVFYGRFLKKLSRETQKAVGELVAVSEERIGAIRTVQAYNAVEPLETHRFKEKVDKIAGLARTEAFASGWSSSFF